MNADGDELSEVRASALPLALLCPGSTRPPLVPVSDSTLPRRLGTAAHECLRSLAETGQVNWALVPAAATRNVVPVDELRILCATAQKLWPAISASFLGAMTEVELSAEVVPGLTLTGHADLLAVRGNVGRAADWKTGRKDHDYSAQMKGYAALILADDDELEVATATVVWLRDQAIENYTMKREELGAWVDELAARILGWNGTFEPGPHCVECPRSHECEASNAMIRRDVAAFADRSLGERIETTLATMEPADILELHRKASMVMHFAGRVKEAIKTHVVLHGEVVADGVKLALEETTKRVIDPLEAWPVLEAAGLTSAELAACMKLSISGIEGVVAKKAGRGKGAAAVRDLGDKLEAAGALSIERGEILKERRT